MSDFLYILGGIDFPTKGCKNPIHNDRNVRWKYDLVLVYNKIYAWSIIRKSLPPCVHLRSHLSCLPFCRITQFYSLCLAFGSVLENSRCNIKIPNIVKIWFFIMLLYLRNLLRAPRDNWSIFSLVKLPWTSLDLSYSRLFICLLMLLNKVYGNDIYVMLL